MYQIHTVAGLDTCKYAEVVIAISVKVLDNLGYGAIQSYSGY